MNFSIPEAVKQAFNEAFGDSNKSAVISDLMRQAIKNRKRAQRRAKAIDRLLHLREKTPPASTEEIQAAREEVRKWP